MYCTGSSRVPSKTKGVRLGSGVVLFAYALVVWVGLACLGDGGAPVPERLTNLAGDEGRPAISPDGGRLIFTAEKEGKGRDLALLDVDRSSLRWLTSSPDVAESDYGWVDDGSAIVYRASGDHGSWILRTDVSDLSTTELTPHTVIAERPRISPSGNAIAYVTYDSSSSTLWTVRTDGTDRLRRFAVDFNFALSGWSADQTAVVGTVVTDTTQDLVSIDVRHGAVTLLTTHPNEEWSVTPAPNGDWIAFYSTYDAEMTDIRVVHRVTGETRRLTSSPSEDFGPTWSPEGTRLGFLSDRTAKSGLWTVPITGGDPTPLLPRMHIDGFPVWSPNGAYIAFQYSEAKERLYRAALDGTVTLVGDDTLEAVSPVVSPDGGRIAFHTTDFGSEGDVAVLDLESGAVRAVTGGPDNVREISWSSDGNRLAVRRNVGGWFRTARIHILDLRSGSDTSITSDGWFRVPLWCGDYIYALRPPALPRTGGWALWRVSVSDGELLKILDANARPRDCRRDGALLYSIVGPQGAQLRWLVVGTRGEIVSDELALDGALAGAISHDGRIAYLARVDGQTDLFVFDPRTSKRDRLTDTPWIESNPDWSRDGRFIYFSAEPGDIDLWRVQVKRE